jgi:Tol biopolymer transport system component
MAPEQFRRDQPFTLATDLYAAGIVLYEMICGRGPFTAATAEQMEEQKSLNQAVPVRQWLPGVSRRWEKALRKAIQADPKLRFATAQDFAAALRPPITRERLWWSAGAAAMLSVVVTAAMYAPWSGSAGNRNGTANAPLAIRKLTSDGGYSMEPALTPDGKTVVFASDRGASGIRSLWKMPTTTDAPPVQLTFETVDSSQPAISPDGRWVVYRSELDGGGLFVIPLDEEAAVPRLLAHGGTRPRISPDGNWVVFMTSPATATQWPQVYAIPLVTDASAPPPSAASAVHVSAGFRDAHNPIWSEDGRHVLFCGTRVPAVPDQEHDWWLVPFAPLQASPGGLARKTGMLPALNRLPQVNPSNRLNEDLGVWKDGYVYYSSPQTDSSSIWRVALSTASPMPVQTVAPQRLTYGPSQDLQPSIGGGRIAFASGASNIDVWMLPLHANTGVPADEPVRITETTDYEVSPSVETVSRTAVFTKVLGGRRELRIMDIRDPSGGGEIRTISGQDEVADHPVWSRDGKWIAYRKFEHPYQRLSVMDRNGGSRRVLCEDCGLPTDWSPDQQYLLVEPGDAIAFVARFEFATGKYIPWISHPEQSLRGARYSPDGNWIAFHAEASPLERRVYIAPNREQSTAEQWIRMGMESFSDVPGAVPVDFQPAWSPDGNLLYWLSGRDGFRCIWAQRLDPATKRPQGPPFAVRHFHRSRRSLLRQVPARATQVGFRVYRDRAYFAMDEVTGTVWIADLPH